MSPHQITPAGIIATMQQAGFATRPGETSDSEKRVGFCSMRSCWDYGISLSGNRRIADMFAFAEIQEVCLIVRSFCSPWPTAAAAHTGRTAGACVLRSRAPQPMASRGRSAHVHDFSVITEKLRSNLMSAPPTFVSDAVRERAAAQRGRDSTLQCCLHVRPSDWNLLHSARFERRQSVSKSNGRKGIRWHSVGRQT